MSLIIQLVSETGQKLDVKTLPEWENRGHTSEMVSILLKKTFAGRYERSTALPDPKEDIMAYMDIVDKCQASPLSSTAAAIIDGVKYCYKDIIFIRDGKIL